MGNERKIYNEFLLKHAFVNSRRHFLKNCTLGMGGMAFSNLLTNCSTDKKSLFDNGRSLNPLAPISPPNLGKVKISVCLQKKQKGYISTMSMVKS